MIALQQMPGILKIKWIMESIEEFDGISLAE